MVQKVLFEGGNLTLSQGTGIATYARNLNIAAKSAGYDTDVLVNVRTPLDRRDPVLNEVNFFDVVAGNRTISERARDARSFLVGAPFGVDAQRLDHTGIVVEAAPAAVKGFDRLYASVNFSDEANNHFMRYGSSAKLRISSRPSLFHATQPMPLTLAGCPNIYTIHDLVPLRLPFATLDNKRHFLKMIRHICKKADHIVTVSEHSRRDIMSLCDVSGDRITNTYQAVNIPKRVLDVSLEEASKLIRNTFQLDFEEYFLFVGAIEPKKNLSRLVDAYAASGSKRPLVIVGGLGWSYDKDLEKIKDDRFSRYQFADGMLSPSRKIRMLSYLPSDQLFALIRGARGLLFPSLYEGFGLPVVEAMQLGAPVMTSNVSSLPEVAGDAAILVDPYSTSEMSRAISMLDNDDGLRADLRERGRKQAEQFSAEKYENQISSLYKRLL